MSTYQNKSLKMNELTVICLLGHVLHLSALLMSDYGDY